MIAVVGPAMTAALVGSFVGVGVWVAIGLRWLAADEPSTSTASPACQHPSLAVSYVVHRGDATVVGLELRCDCGWRFVHKDEKCPPGWRP